MDQIERTILGLHHLLSQTPDDHPSMPLWLAALGEAYECRFDLVNEPGNLDKAIEYALIALSMNSDSDPGLPHLLELLGRLHSKRSERMGTTEDMEKGMEYLSMVIALIPDQDPSLPMRLANLGSSHSLRYQRLDDMTDLEMAIKHGTRAVALTTNSHPHLPGYLTNLGECHRKRHERLGERADLDKSIECHTRAIALAPNGHPFLAGCFRNLGLSHSDRYKRLGELTDLDKAIECKARAVALAPADRSHLPTNLASLGASHSDRYERLEELTDLEKAVECHTRAVTLTPDDHPNLPVVLASLGASHAKRYERLGQLTDLEKANECGTRAVALTPDGHPDLPERLASLGGFRFHRFERLGQLADIDKALECGTRAVTLTPDGHPDLPSRLMSLGIYHGNRYGRLGQQTDLDKAIERQTRAVALTPDGHPHLPRILASLGMSHARLYERLGELVDIEKAIECGTRAAALTPNGHSDLPMYLANLGVSYKHRYRRLGETIDLDKAIECETRGVESIPNSHPHFPSRLSNLGVSHRERYKRLGRLADLDKAIECKNNAVELTPNGHPDLPKHLANLGASHVDRYERLKEPTDLDKAIKCQTRAVSLTPDGHQAMPRHLINLGVSHINRYESLGALSDLEKATEYNARVLVLLPNGHPDTLIAQLNSALAHFARSRRSGDPSHWQDSLDAFRSASQVPTGSPRVKFTSAYTWAKRASVFHPLNPLEAYQTTISLLPQFVWLGATTHQRYQDLATTQTLAVEAASVAIRFSDFSLALEWLEQARCVVWNQSLMLRTPLDQLQAHHPALAAHLETISNQLHIASSQSRELQAHSSDSLSIEQVAQEHRRLAVEYDELIVKARKLPGFEDFLQPMKATDLARAAQNGPVIVINCHEDRCDALLIQPGQDGIQHLPLTDFTAEDAKTARLHMRKSLASKGIRERGVKEKRPQRQADNFGMVLATLWHKVVKPVLDFLGYMSNTQTGDLPHITWCPTGAISFLPLHAAGDYDQPRSRVFDYVVSSYTPTLAALLTSTPTILSANSRMLAIGQEATPGHKPLPETTRELEYIHAHAHNIAQYTQLKNEQATASAVLDAMEKHDWVHLACHAHQNVSDPTKSGFFLHDGTLDLAAINRRSFKHKGLAFLSACQTATGDEDLPDEAIHLASGILMAGYSSVIATMWSVFDSDAPVVADKVYEQLMRDRKLGNGEAGKALHNAVAELRERVGEKAFEQWVPYIHIGS